MNAQSGRMALLILILLVVFFAAFVLTPLALAPLGVFTGLAHGARDFTFGAWHFRPWFPFFPIWGFSLFFLIVWIAIIVWVYKDAESRGMSGLLWSLLVFFGNFIGLLIFLIVRQDHPVSGGPGASRTTVPPSSSKTSPGSAQPAAGPSAPPAAASTAGTAAAASLACPNCHKPVEKAFTYCPHCGSPLLPVCKNCGKSVDPAWRTCPYCGTTLKSE